MWTEWILCLAAPLGTEAGNSPQAPVPSKTLVNGAMRVTIRRRVRERRGAEVAEVR